MANIRYNPDLFTSDGFLNESLFNESQDPNVVLTKLRDKRRISNLFNRKGSDKEEDADNSSFGIHRIVESAADAVVKEEVEEIQVQPDSPLCRLQNSDQVALPPLQYAENASEKFKKPSNPIKPVSRISIRRSLFQTDPNPINQQKGLVCSTPVNNKQMRFFQYIAPLSPILFSKNHSQPATISSSKPPAIESRIDRDEQVPDVSSSQFNKTWNQAKTLPRPQIALLNREALPSFNTFHNRSREVESPVLSPVISSPNLRSASRALVADLDVDMEPNEDNLMEIDFHDVPKTCAGKLSKRNTTNYESNLEETQTKPSHHRDISTPLKEVQERLAVADISLEEEPVENVADKNNDQQECETNMAPIILEVQNIEVEVQNIEVEMQNIEVVMQKIHEEQNTIIEEGDEGLPLIPIYDKSQTSSVIQDTFVLPTKKRKKPVQVAQEALVYLQLTNKSSKRIQDQSLGLSKRTLYSPDIDELEDELVLNNVESVPPTLPCSSGLSHHVQIVEPIKKQLINTRCAVSIPATLADDVLTETPEAVVDNVQKQYNKKTSRDLSQEVNQAEVEVCEENFEPAIVQNRVSKRISALKAAKASTDKEPIKKNNTSSAKGKIVLKGAIKKASSQDTQSGSAVTKVSKAPSETGKADKLNAKNSSPISTKSKSNMKSASTNQRNQPADTEEVCLRRGTRERKLPRMFWSTRHADVCFRYGVVDKPEAKVTKTKRLVNKNIPTLKSMEKQGLKGIFSICDKILDENFRPIKNIEKFFKKKAINKKNQYQRILLNSSEISEEETSERNTEPVPEHETDLERRIRESRKRKKSLLRGPKCKRGKSLEKDPVP